MYNSLEGTEIIDVLTVRLYIKAERKINHSFKYL